MLVLLVLNKRNPHGASMLMHNRVRSKFGQLYWKRLRGDGACGAQNANMTRFSAFSEHFCAWPNNTKNTVVWCN